MERMRFSEVIQSFLRWFSQSRINVFLRRTKFLTIPSLFFGIAIWQGWVVGESESIVPWRLPFPDAFTVAIGIAFSVLIYDWQESSNKARIIFTAPVRRERDTWNLVVRADEYYSSIRDPHIFVFLSNKRLHILGGYPRTQDNREEEFLKEFPAGDAYEMPRHNSIISGNGITIAIEGDGDLQKGQENIVLEIEAKASNAPCVRKRYNIGIGSDGKIINIS